MSSHAIRLQPLRASQPCPLEEDRGHGESEKDDLHAQQAERFFGRAVDRDADQPRGRDYPDGGREHGQTGQQALLGKQTAEQDERQGERKSSEADPNPADRHHRPENDRVRRRLVDRVAEVLQADEREQDRGEEQQDPRQPGGRAPEEGHVSSETTLEYAGRIDAEPGLACPKAARTSASTFAGCERTRKSLAWLIHRTLPSASTRIVAGIAMSRNGPPLGVKLRFCRW